MDRFEFTIKGKHLWRIALVVALVATAWPSASWASHRFGDVPDTNVFHDDIAWLADAGVTKGCNPPANTEFCPSSVVTREQMAAFLRRLAVNQVVDAIPYVAGNGIAVKGKEISLDPPFTVSADRPGTGTQAGSSVVSAINTSTDFNNPMYGIYGGASGYYMSAGVLGRGTNNFAVGVLGEAGDVSGLVEILGAVGVVARGANRGLGAVSGDGIGAYGYSNQNYGVWGQSDGYRGATGRTSRADNNYGLYTPDNLFSLNYNLAGAVMVIVENGGPTELHPGDVVEFSGVTAPTTVYEAAMPRVAAASAASRSVAGVVFRGFNLASVLEDTDGTTPPTQTEVTVEGAVAPGEHLLLVVLGAAQVRVAGGPSPVIAGDTLGLSSSPGAAAPTAELREGTVRGPVVGLALEPLDAARDGLVWTFIGRS